MVGYRCGSAVYCYRDLKEKTGVSQSQREFATTGVVLQIQEPWFTGNSEHALKTRTTSEALAAVLSREHGIAPSEIRTAHSSIAIYTDARPRRVDDAIVIFDNVVGGLRLNLASVLHVLCNRGSAGAGIHNRRRRCHPERNDRG